MPQIPSGASWRCQRMESDSEGNSGIFKGISGIEDEYRRSLMFDSLYFPNALCGDLRDAKHRNLECISDFMLHLFSLPSFSFIWHLPKHEKKDEEWNRRCQREKEVQDSPLECSRLSDINLWSRLQVFLRVIPFPFVWNFLWRYDGNNSGNDLHLAGQKDKVSWSMGLSFLSSELSFQIFPSIMRDRVFSQDSLGIQKR